MNPFDDDDICPLCGCTEPNPDCQKCSGTQEPVDHRDPYKDWIEQQDSQDSLAYDLSLSHH